MPVETQEVAFEALYLRLRQEGFRTGVDQQLRMQELLEGLECGPADLKTVLCPIFATNPTQQAVFYRVFDEVFSSLAAAPAPAQLMAAQENNAGDVFASEARSRTGWLRRARWLLVLAVFVGGGLLFWAFHKPHDKDAPPPPPPDVKVNSSPQAPLVELRTVNLPLPPDVPVIHPDAHWIDFVWSAIFTPLLAFMAFAYYRYLRRRASLNRQSSLQEPHFWPLQLEALGSRIFRAEDVRETARRMRQREDAMQFTLDVPATISATLRGHGFPNFRYRAIRRPPEYIILIERLSNADHFAALTSDLVQMLQAEGVLLFRYYFEGSPRRLFTESGDQIDLFDLAPRTADSRLLMFASSGTLFHPISGKLEAWVQPIFETYKLKSILLSDTPRRKRIERLQDVGFAVVPADSAGVRETVDFFESGGVQAGKAFPAFSALDPAPSEEDLETANPDPLFSWIAACAVYPELNWNLTLRLASAIDPKLACEREASKIARMAWFRNGEIPAPALERLTANLPEHLGRRIEESLYGLLNSQLIPKDTFAWENWQNTMRAFRPTVQSWRDRWRALMAEGPDTVALEAAQDLRFIQFLNRHAKTRALLRIPEWLRSHVFEQGMDVFGTRTMAWLPVALMASLLVAVSFRPWQTHVEDIRQVAGRIVDDSGRPFVDAQVNGMSPQADGRFDLVLRGKDLPIVTPVAFLPPSIESVGGGRVKILVAKAIGPASVPSRDLPPPKTLWCYQEKASAATARLSANSPNNEKLTQGFGAYCHSSKLNCDAARPKSGTATDCAPLSEIAAARAWSGTPRSGLSGSLYRLNLPKPLQSPFPQFKDVQVAGITPGDKGSQKPEIVSFTAEPPRVKAGDDVTLRWSVNGVAALQLSRTNTRALPVTNPPNPTVVKNLQMTTTFQLQMLNVPDSGIRAVTVTVDPATPSGDKSQPGTPSVTVVFRNATSAPVEVYWVDFEGTEKGYGTIAAGATSTQVTGVNHIWRFRQGGPVIGTYTAPNAEPGQQYIIQPPPGACVSGYVWREGSPTDHVCVTPAVRNQTALENAQAADRRAGSGDYGADTCKLGFVWRDAFANDHVCVEPAVRDQAANDNRLAASRVAGAKKSAY
jgi:hypothetical protein